MRLAARNLTLIVALVVALLAVGLIFSPIDFKRRWALHSLQSKFQYDHGNFLAQRDQATCSNLEALIPLSDEVRVIRIANCPRVDDCLGDVLSHMSKLEHVRITNTPVGDRAIGMIPGSLVQSAEFTETRISSRSLESVGQWARLSSLDLTNTRVSSAGLDHLTGCPLLHDLILRNTDVTACPARAAESWPRLTELWLNGTPASHADLADWLRIPSLQNVYAYSTAFNDATARVAADHPQLKYLHVRDTDLTDAGLLTLMESRSLKSVMISEDKITPAGLLAAQRANPAVEIHLDRSN